MTDTQVATTNISLPTTMGELISQFVRVRTALDDADKKHQEKTKAVREYKALLEKAMIEELNKSNTTSVKSDDGTAYLTHRKSATVADQATFRQFIINTEQFDLVDWRANAPNVSEWIDKVGQGNPPPGVNYSVNVTVGVRRA